MELKFTVQITPVTKKNHSRIVHAGKKHVLLPSEQYVQYEKDAGWFLPKLPNPINYPINVQAIYYMPTKRAVDLCNLHEALCDVLKTYGVVEDDNSNIIATMDGSKVEYDKVNPRTEVIIKDVVKVEYRKKPVVIEAEVYKPGMEDGFDYEKESYPGEYRDNIHLIGTGWQPKKKQYINTLEGKMYINEGDYIITGVKGERYPCKPEIFKISYEPANKKISPKTICLCGSTKYKEEFEKANKEFTLQGYIVLSVGFFGHKENKFPSEETKQMLDELHKRKIDIADVVYILDVDCYIGKSTQSEIDYATKNGKKIKFLSEDGYSLKSNN